MKELARSSCIESPLSPRPRPNPRVNVPTRSETGCRYDRSDTSPRCAWWLAVRGNCERHAGVGSEAKSQAVALVSIAVSQSGTRGRGRGRSRQGQPALLRQMVLRTSRCLDTSLEGQAVADRLLRPIFADQLRRRCSPELNLRDVTPKRTSSSNVRRGDALAGHGRSPVTTSERTREAQARGEGASRDSEDEQERGKERQRARNPRASSSASPIGSACERVG